MKYFSSFHHNGYVRGPTITNGYWLPAPCATGILYKGQVPCLLYGLLPAGVLSYKFSTQISTYDSTSSYVCSVESTCAYLRHHFKAYPYGKQSLEETGASTLFFSLLWAFPALFSGCVSSGSKKCLSAASHVFKEEVPVHRALQ